MEQLPFTNCQLPYSLVLTLFVGLTQQKTTPKKSKTRPSSGFLSLASATKPCLLKSFKQKLHRCLPHSNIKIKAGEKTTWLCFYTTNKDKVPPLSKSHVVYKFSCPGCHSTFIGKIELFSSEQMNTLSLTKRVQYTHPFEPLIFKNNLCNLPDTLNFGNFPPHSCDKENFSGYSII